MLVHGSGPAALIFIPSLNQLEGTEKGWSVQCVYRQVYVSINTRNTKIRAEHE